MEETVPETTEAKAKRLDSVLSILGPLYPDHRPLLTFETPFQLLTATVLAAQCTDAAVNTVTPELFGAWPDAAALAEAPLKELERIVHPTGFFRAKAHNIKALSRQLVENYGGKVPPSMENLTRLPGVGRKTASVVLSACFGEPAIIVDTHFARVCGRLGFTGSERPEVIEGHVASITPRERWIETSHVLNRFGRDICRARKPECGRCPVGKLCPEISTFGTLGENRGSKAGTPQAERPAPRGKFTRIL